ncbi:flavin reductase family protein [Marinibaculum pumilum]|uniref:Flavin reductase family protein n=1 Tax=Marinibaculum pumilum TaxID=1766165 RepID=A0ABV7L5L5_9PROT
MPELDPTSLRAAFGGFATGVTVITTTTEDGDHGMTANAFMSVSLSPPLISVSLSRDCRMLGHVRQAGRYVVNVLRHDMEALAWHFAGRSDPSLRDPIARSDGHPVIAGAVARFFADLETEVPAGDHVILIGRVTGLSRDPAAEPLLFCGGRFGRLSPVPRSGNAGDRST